MKTTRVRTPPTAARGPAAPAIPPANATTAAPITTAMAKSETSTAASVAPISQRFVQSIVRQRRPTSSPASAKATNRMPMDSGMPAVGLPT
jgi:hypothetical protein